MSTKKSGHSISSTSASNIFSIPRIRRVFVDLRYNIIGLIVATILVSTLAEPLANLLLFRHRDPQSGLIVYGNAEIGVDDSEILGQGLDGTKEKDHEIDAVSVIEIKIFGAILLKGIAIPSTLLCQYGGKIYLFANGSHGKICFDDQGNQILFPDPLREVSHELKSLKEYIKAKAIRDAGMDGRIEDRINEQIAILREFFPHLIKE